MTEDRFLYPRLAGPYALAKLREWHGAAVEELRGLVDEWEPRTRYYEIGDKVDAATIRKLRDDLRDMAGRHGYPSSRRRRGLSAFDRETGERMLEEPILDVGSDDVWCYVASGLVPDVVVWRWNWPSTSRLPADELPARSFDRFLGGFRNTFRRGWYRLTTYGAGEDDPPAIFWEDALVNMEERPSIGSNPRVASRLFHATRPLLDIEPYELREEIFRYVAKTVCEIAGWRELRVMSDSVLSDLLHDIVEEHVPEDHKEHVARNRRSRPIHEPTNTTPQPAEALGESDQPTDPAGPRDHFDVEVTEGALRNSYLSVRDAHDGFFPSWAGESGRNLEFLFEGLEEVVQSDVVPGKRVVRARGATRSFYERNDVQAGDVIRVVREGTGRFRVMVREEPQ